MKSDSIGINNITYKSVVKSIFKGSEEYIITVSYTHLTLPTTPLMCRSRWSPYH